MTSTLTVSRQKGVAVIETALYYETTDSESIREVRVLLLSEADTAEPPLILVDLRQTRYFGSPFVGLLFETWLRLRERRGRLAFCSPQPDVHRVLDTVQLKKVCPIFATREEALAALAPPA